MSKRDFVHTSDFSRQDYDETFRRVLVFDRGLATGRTFHHLLPGRVLASLFLDESTRTMTAFQAAIVRLGGGWTGMTGKQGTYLATGEEDLADLVGSIAEVSDIMVLRYKNCQPAKLAANIAIPLVNGLCGGDEHAIAGVGIAYAIYKKWGSLHGRTIGIRGLVTETMGALIGTLAPFGTRFLVDPVLDAFRVPDPIVQRCRAAGSSIEHAPLDAWIGEVDFLGIGEGKGYWSAEDDVAFNAAFRPFVVGDFDRMRKDALVFACQPRRTSDGRITIDKACDAHPNNVTFSSLKDFPYVAMGMMTYLLDVPVG
ncbi:MAG: hypothetical protein NT062_18590 [Proteobacteria bacterium]|nr:hypothetical protein [Pseudomonadota bacterium]